jgi:hypothetical protein
MMTFDVDSSSKGSWRRTSREVSSANFASSTLMPFVEGEAEKSRVEIA